LPRKRTPPPTVVVVNRRSSRSIERKPEVIREEVISYPIVQSTQPSPSKGTLYFTSSINIKFSFQNLNFPNPKHSISLAINKKTKQFARKYHPYPNKQITSPILLHKINQFNYPTINLPTLFVLINLFAKENLRLNHCQRLLIRMPRESLDHHCMNHVIE